MTLSTNIVAMDPIDPERVFMHAAKLLGADEGYRWEHKQDGMRGHPGIWAEVGQGLPAWLILTHNNGELLRMYEDETPDPGDPRLGMRDEHGDEMCYFRPQGYVDVDFDTAYGYGKDYEGVNLLHGNPRDLGFGRCGDLHAWLVREMTRWFDSQGVRWYWRDEYTGEWFNTLDSLGQLGDPELGGKNPQLRHLKLKGV